MPFQEPVKNKKISKEMLNFKIPSVSAVSQNGKMLESEITTLGEIVNYGDIIEEVDGVSFLANNESQNKIGVALAFGAIGSVIGAQFHGMAHIPDVEFEPGKPVYLLQNTVKPTTNIPNYSQTGYFRKIGYAFTTNILELIPEQRNYVE